MKTGLQRITLFADLPPALLAVVNEACVMRQRPKDALLLCEGEVADGLYLLFAGSVAAVRAGSDGRETIVALLKEGDFFGETSIFDGSPCPASIRAVTAVELGVLEQPALVALLEQHAAFGRALVLGLVQRLREANTLFAVTTAADIRARLALLLLQLADHFGEPAEPGMRIRLRLTNQQLADMIGTTRETVNRTLNKFWDEHLIDMRTAHITVLDREALAALVS